MAHYGGPAHAVFLITAQAQENVPLKAGVGRETVEASCGACHSLDYPRRHKKFGTLTEVGEFAISNKTCCGRA